MENGIGTNLFLYRIENEANTNLKLKANKTKTKRN